MAVHVPGTSASVSAHTPALHLKVWTIRVRVPVLVQVGGSTHGPQGSGTVVSHVVPFGVNAS